MNLIAGEVAGDGSRFRSSGVGFELDLPSGNGAVGRTGRKVFLGVRPEDLRIVLPGQGVDPRSLISARVHLFDGQSRERLNP